LASAEPILRVEGLGAAYGSLIALRQVSFDVQPGESIAVLGANGAGKTSLLRALSGLMVRRTGRVSLRGSEIQNRPAHEIVTLGLAHVPEGRHLFPPLSVAENLAAGAYPLRRRGSGSDEARALNFVFELFPALAERRSQAVGTLSGGEQQMVAIGRALVANPRLLLLDEPSLGLSPKFTQAVYGALHQVSDRIPMLLVEQNTVMALRHCTRAAVMVGGKLVLEGTAEDLADREALVASYLGEEPALAGEEAALHAPQTS
jgi:branched-chain amino acid transport system ATP-binding protein